MTPDRAYAILQKGNQWPFWGNYRKFMTPEEQAEVEEHVRQAPEDQGHISIERVLQRISQSRDPRTGATEEPTNGS